MFRLPLGVALGYNLHSMGTLTYRTFRNTDPPVLTELWRSRAEQPGLVQPVSPDLLEQFVFAKLYFEYSGLFLAFDDGRPVGFAHAGFGPNESQSWTSTQTGVTSIILVRPDYAEPAEVASGLLERCEQYLRSHGVKELYGGELLPCAPFYLGLYGGSESPGVLNSDPLAQQIFSARGYEIVSHTLLFRRDLGGFESLIDRQQMQIRRQMIVEVTADAPTRTWWEASTLGGFDLTRFELMPRGGGATIATALFRAIEPSAINALGPAAGLMYFHVEETCRRRGVAHFLLSEAFRQFIRQGIMRVEAQAPQQNDAALATMRKLGFQQVAEGNVFRKEP